MNAAEWNAKYPVGTHVVVNQKGVERIRTNGSNLGLSDDGRTVTIRSSPGSGTDGAAVDYGGNIWIYLKGVRGWTPIEFVEPCDPPSPEHMAEMAKRANAERFAKAIIEDARMGVWSDVEASARSILMLTDPEDT